MYKELRESMTEIYQDVDVKIFGPANATDFDENTKSNVYQNKNIETNWKEEKELMIRGRNRIIEKVKDICQNFSKAVTQLGLGQEVERLFMSFLINQRLFVEDMRTQNHFNLEFNMMILLIMEVMMI